MSIHMRSGPKPHYKVISWDSTNYLIFILNPPENPKHFGTQSPSNQTMFFLLNINHANQPTSTWKQQKTNNFSNLPSLSQPQRCEGRLLEDFALWIQWVKFLLFLVLHRCPCAPSLGVKRNRYRCLPLKSLSGCKLPGEWVFTSHHEEASKMSLFSCGFAIHPQFIYVYVLYIYIVNVWPSRWKLFEEKQVFVQ